MAGEFGSRTGVVTVVDVDGAAAAGLASRAGDVVQLAREALSNVGRHGAATTCASRSDEEIPAFPRDRRRGRGFDADVTSWGMGLQNLRERVESLGGVLDVESTPGEGTTVRATFPPDRSRRMGAIDPSPASGERASWSICSQGIRRAAVLPRGSRASPVSGPAFVASRVGGASPPPWGRAPRRGGVRRSRAGQRTVAVGWTIRRDRSTFVFALRWAASGGADLFPSLDADLEVAPIRPGRTQLAMSARYVPPFGTVGRVIDRAVLSRVAEATLKDFLDRVAESIMGSRDAPSPAEPRRAAPAPA